MRERDERLLVSKLVRETVIPLRTPGRAYLWAGLGVIASIAASWVLIARSPTASAGSVQSATDADRWAPTLARDHPIGLRVELAGPSAEEPDQLRGVVSHSGRLGVLAAWTDDTVYASFDDGRSFAPVLHGEGWVDGVATDGRGWVYVLRNRTSLGVIRRPGVTSWRQLPYASETYAMHAAAGYLAWLHDGPEDVEGRSHGRLTLTIDGGRSLTEQRVPHLGNTDNRLRVDANGALQILTLDQDDDGSETTRRFVGHVDGRPWQELPWSQAPGLGTCAQEFPRESRSVDQLGRTVLLRGRRVLRGSERHGWRQLMKL